MPSVDSELEFLYQALGSPPGIVVASANIQLSIQRLYKARSESGDPELDCIQIRRSPDRPDEIWIIRGQHVPRKPNAVPALFGGPAGA